MNRLLTADAYPPQEPVPPKGQAYRAEAARRAAGVEGFEASYGADIYQRIALFNVAGKIHAIDDTCPHAGAPLSEGQLNGCVVTCPWHAIRFDVTSGRVPGQSDDSLAVYPTFINGDQIEVEV